MKGRGRKGGEAIIQEEMQVEEREEMWEDTPYEPEAVCEPQSLEYLLLGFLKKSVPGVIFKLICV